MSRGNVVLAIHQHAARLLKNLRTFQLISLCFKLINCYALGANQDFYGRKA